MALIHVWSRISEPGQDWWMLDSVVRSQYCIMQAGRPQVVSSGGMGAVPSALLLLPPQSDICIPVVRLQGLKISSTLNKPVATPTPAKLSTDAVHSATSITLAISLPAGPHPHHQPAAAARRLSQRADYGVCVCVCVLLEE